MKLKEDFARSDLEKDKLIMDLQVKFDKARLERSQYELELTKTREALIRSEQVYHGKISTLEDQLTRSQSLYTELDESSKLTIEKLRNEGSTDLSEIHRKYELSIRKKDENIRTAMNEIESLKSLISSHKTEALERKADEEMRMNEKIKEFNNLQRQFHDSIVHEQETKIRQSQAHNEKLHRMQEDMKAELEKIRVQHQKEID